MLVNILFLTSDEDYVLDFIKYALEDLLEDTQVNVFGTQSETEAFEILQRENISLIIADMDLQSLESYDFYDKLSKSNDNTIPFVFLSSNEEDQEISMLKGIENFFLKPLNEKDLTGKINNILNKTTPCNNKTNEQVLEEIDALSIKIDTILNEAKKLTTLIKDKAAQLKS